MIFLFSQWMVGTFHRMARHQCNRLRTPNSCAQPTESRLAHTKAQPISDRFPAIDLSQIIGRAWQRDQWRCGRQRHITAVAARTRNHQVFGISNCSLTLDVACMARRFFTSASLPSDLAQEYARVSPKEQTSPARASFLLVNRSNRSQHTWWLSVMDTSPGNNPGLLKTVRALATVD